MQLLLCINCCFLKNTGIYQLLSMGTTAHNFKSFSTICHHSILITEILHQVKVQRPMLLKQQDRKSILAATGLDCDPCSCRESKGKKETLDAPALATNIVSRRTVSSWPLLPHLQMDREAGGWEWGMSRNFALSPAPEHPGWYSCACIKGEVTCAKNRACKIYSPHDTRGGSRDQTVTQSQFRPRPAPTCSHLGQIVLIQLTVMSQGDTMSSIMTMLSQATDFLQHFKLPKCISVHYRLIKCIQITQMLSFLGWQDFCLKMEQEFLNQRWIQGLFVCKEKKNPKNLFFLF